MAELRILFVDDESAVLDGIRDLLRRDRQKWEAHFATSGEMALETLEAGGFDVVVTDMLMPKMDGGELLREVKERHPEVTRIVLSGHADIPAVTRALPLAQQYLAKPCEGVNLRSVIARAQSLKALMKHPTLVSMVGGFGHLPTAPSIFLELSAVAGDPNVGISELAAIVERDPALSAKVLQVANSAFFSLSTRAKTVVQAATYLGAQTIRAITLSAQLEQSLRGKIGHELSLDEYQSKALLTATLARSFSHTQPEGDQAFTAAMILNLGSLVLALGAPRQALENAKRAARENRPLEAIEREVWGVCHAEVGAYLLGTWGLPATLVDLVRCHHSLAEAPEDTRSISLALHLAETIVQTNNAPDERLDWDFLASLGESARVSEYQRRAAQLFESNRSGRGS